MDAIIAKYGFKEGLTTKDGEITNWPYDEKKPSQTKLDQIVKDYVVANQYKIDRKYKSISEQLDMQYWDKKNGTNSWEEYIDSVKAGAPKK